jgi:hypothetical protein
MELFTNITQLKSFLGLMNYYGKYLPDLATVLNPLHRLLHKGQQWKWDQSCEDAFRKVKDLGPSIMWEITAPIP